ACVTALAQAVTATPVTFCHPVLDVLGQPAPDRDFRHVQLLAGEPVHDHRDRHTPAAPAPHELPHSLAGRRGLLRRLATGISYGRPHGDTGQGPGSARKAPGHARNVLTRRTNGHNWSPRAQATHPSRP